MKPLRIPLVIALLVVAGQAFHANAQTVTNLYSFGNLPDGNNSRAGLVQGNDGNFYGTTYGGGTNNNGTVFQISPSGTYTSLYSFATSPDGANPQAGLIQGSDGNFYGTTYGGGTYNNGTVFQISPSGTYTSLYSFANYPDGANPEAGLVQGSDGNFYGTTEQGGMNRGSVFRISPSGSYTNLYSIFSHGGDGLNPEAGLVQGSDGNFYGTTSIDQTFERWGHLFRISPNGTETNLYRFVFGQTIVAGLVQGSDGNFYGTTVGTVFRLSVPLNPAANQISAIQKSGTNIIVALPSVAGETYQLQFSSSMNPTNWVNVSGLSVTNSIGALLTFTNFNGAVGTQGFYRFDITP
jgi:uncharacterized repeat protein (TIGR03803 family)